MNFHPFVFLWKHWLSDKAYMNFQLAGNYIRVRSFNYNKKKKVGEQREKKREQSINMYSILTLEENREERKKWLESESAWDL